MLKFTPERRLSGGVRLPPRKAESTGLPILYGLVPPKLLVSVRQHAGPAATPVVSVGDTVLGGATIARCDAPSGADVHAPTSGRVAAIEPHDVPLGAGVGSEVCIVIETDGRDRKTTPANEAGEISAAGIVGLGGAVFPTEAKIGTANNCEMLIINGAECEPYISCDDMLMRESPDDILDGARILSEMLGSVPCVVAIERDKPQAIDAMTAAAEKLGDANIRIAELPSIYPAGGERQLVEILAGIEVPHGTFPSEVGFVCQNVGTCHALSRYFRDGVPLTTRVVTVTGLGVAEPRCVEAMIGTPIADLVAACGGYRRAPDRLIHGGSMMGYALPTDALPITKATNCIVAADRSEVHWDAREWPCIRCGECAMACPARLQPQELLIAARRKDPAALDTLALDECIECGCCDVVCPSHIPLTTEFRGAKPLLREYADQQALSAVADQRYRSREKRRREAIEEQDRRRAALLGDLASDGDRAQAIRAAVERARARRQQDDER